MKDSDYARLEIVKRNARRWYSQIINHEASCGHTLLREIHPDWYMNFRAAWMELQSLDKTTPDLPWWAGCGTEHTP